VVQNFGESLFVSLKFDPLKFYTYIAESIEKMHVILVLKMAGHSILQYCKLVYSQSLSSSSEIPDPNGLLSKKISSRAIELASAKVPNDHHENTQCWVI